MFFTHSANIRRQAFFPAHFGRALVAVLAFALVTWVSPMLASADTKTATDVPADAGLSIELGEAWKPWVGDLDGMIERRVIRVLTVYNKTLYFVDKGTQRGTAYEMFREFEADFNAKLASSKQASANRLKVQVVFIPVAREDLLQALVDGKGDIAVANLTVTEERLKLVDFSAPVYQNVSEVVVSGPASPVLSSIDDLAGKQVFVRKSSSHFEHLESLNRRFAAENKPAIVIREAPPALENEDLIELVSAGLLPLIVIDKPLADFWKQVFPGITVHEDIAVHTGSDIAWAIRKDSPELKKTLDEFVAGHRKGTLLGNVIFKRYLVDAKYVNDAASEAERKKLSAVAKYFQKYGDQYDVDWLLMAAQGYQESRLNQSVKSPVGAIGIMQIMPSTGQELGVGDITEIEANIHGGVKYMRWMIDQYYADEPMTRLDKALFALASYNAGAGRIRGFRAEAARRGLDPNVWFHNVEYISAEKTGPETVAYVANIYKYYIAYSLIMEARNERERALEAVRGASKPAP
jgi:membrane-bound lytic murein transglycosylase MltF